MQSINYGNRLQNYALQRVLEGYGNKVASLRRERIGALHPLKRRARLLLKDDKLNAFYRFDADNLRLSNFVLSTEFTTPQLAEASDLFVIGSDQVWNPTFFFNSELEYLPMVPPFKKLAYAASFGVSEITENRERTAELLDGIPFISMREQAGAEIVYDLTGREVPVVLDPTMLLTAGEWSRIARRPKTINLGRPFVFKYVLGSDVNERSIAAIASEHGWDIVDVMDDSLKFGPAEFVWLAANCELVCTDSFHASVFALLNHKPLAIFERAGKDVDMSSRFDTLCALFALKDHRSSESGFGPDAIFGEDWDSFELRLAQLRVSSRGWLQSSLAEVARG